MTSTLKWAALLILSIGLVAGLASCIMEDRLVEIVVSADTCETFTVNEDRANFVYPKTVDFGEQLNDILEENDVARDELVSAHLVTATYAVTEFSHAHDWTISGGVTVERLDVPRGPATLYNYTSASVEGTLGLTVTPDLVEAGVTILNEALADFIAGANPVITFRVDNSAVSPAPSASDRIQFDWRACLSMQIITTADIEVPDPF